MMFYDIIFIHFSYEFLQEGSIIGESIHQLALGHLQLYLRLALK